MYIYIHRPSPTAHCTFSQAEVLAKEREETRRKHAEEAAARKFEGYVTKFAPHTDLKLFFWCLLMKGSYSTVLWGRPKCWQRSGRRLGGDTRRRDQLSVTLSVTETSSEPPYPRPPLPFGIAYRRGYVWLTSGIFKNRL